MADSKRKPPTRQPNWALMEEYAAWTAMTKRLKTSLSLPVTKKAFAEFKGISERTLYRYDKDPSFLRMVEQRKLEQVGQAPGSGAAVGPPRPFTDARSVRSKGLTPPAPATEQDDPVYAELEGAGLDEAEIQYLKVKGTLARMAADGNQGAMDLYLKHYGKAFIEAEREDSNPFAEMSDAQLVGKVLEMIGVEYVADWVAGQAVDG